MLGLSEEGNSSRKAVAAIDAVAGRNMARMRAARGLSQVAVADKLGLSYQMIQRYEAGHVRFSVSRAAEIAKVLRVPLEKLFEGTGVFDRTDLPAMKLSPEAIELAMSHDAIVSPALRSELRNLARTMAQAED